jgi:hypothetical protein|tara:strand:- start:16474 stop:16731 length:258 start_codon:yes stop_codon:yes gene_type:complete
MADTHVPFQLGHVTGMKHIPNQANPFSLIKAATDTGHDACSILTPMLKHRQCIIELQFDIAFTDNSDNATHGLNNLVFKDLLAAL